MPLVLHNPGPSLSTVANPPARDHPLSFAASQHLPFAVALQRLTTHYIEHIRLTFDPSNKSGASEILPTKTSPRTHEHQQTTGASMGALSSLLPLVVLFVVIAGAGFIGYQIYLWSNELADRGQKHMEKKNMNFTKDGGLRVGVKQMGAEEYADRTQRSVCTGIAQAMASC